MTWTSSLRSGCRELKLALLTALLCATIPALASDLLWPLPYGKTLTGGFADSRPDHFHGGVDLRTGPEPREVIAPTDGFVERIAVTPNGYGRTIYYRLHDGRTAVFGHLSKFAPLLEAMLRDSQLARGTFRVDFTPDSTNPDVQFHRGDVLCYTGQSGMGPPHLHFEIREGAVQTDPLANYPPRDSDPPVITSLRWVKASEFTPWSAGTPIAMTKRSPAEWVAPNIYSDDAIAFFISCYDPGPWGRNAVPVAIRVECDNRIIYESASGRIDLLGPKNIYDELVFSEWQGKRDIRRLFDPLPSSQKVEGSTGWMDFSSECRIVVEDRAGNLSSVTLSLEINPSAALAAVNASEFVGKEVVQGRFTLHSKGDPHATWIDLESLTHTESEVEITPANVGFADRLRLSYQLNGESYSYRYFYQYRSDGGKRPLWRIPSDEETNSMSCYILRAGTYGVGYDSTPPKLLLSARGGRLYFTLTDDASDIDDSTVRCKVDGKTAVPEYEYEEDGGYIWTDERLARGTEHDVEFVAADRAGNEKTWNVSVRIP